MSTEIKVITYEKERLDYFTKLMEKSRKRYKRLYEKHSNCGYMSPEYQLLCDAGRKAQFHKDVVEMLEAKEKHEKYFSPEEVRQMSRAEVRENYQAIFASMKRW